MATEAIRLATGALDGPSQNLSIDIAGEPSSGGSAVTATDPGYNQKWQRETGLTIGNSSNELIGTDDPDIEPTPLPGSFQYPEALASVDLDNLFSGTETNFGIIDVPTTTTFVVPVETYISLGSMVESGAIDADNDGSIKLTDYITALRNLADATDTSHGAIDDFETLIQARATFMEAGFAEPESESPFLEDRIAFSVNEDGGVMAGIYTVLTSEAIEIESGLPIPEGSVIIQQQTNEGIVTTIVSRPVGENTNVRPIFMDSLNEETILTAIATYTPEEGSEMVIGFPISTGTPPEMLYPSSLTVTARSSINIRGENEQTTGTMAAPGDSFPLMGGPRNFNVNGGMPFFPIRLPNGTMGWVAGGVGYTEIIPQPSPVPQPPTSRPSVDATREPAETVRPEIISPGPTEPAENLFIPTAEPGVYRLTPEAVSVIEGMPKMDFPWRLPGYPDYSPPIGIDYSVMFSSDPRLAIARGDNIFRSMQNSFGLNNEPRMGAGYLIPELVAPISFESVQGQETVTYRVVTLNENNEWVLITFYANYIDSPETKVWYEDLNNQVIDSGMAVPVSFILIQNADRARAVPNRTIERWVVEISSTPGYPPVGWFLSTPIK